MSTIEDLDEARRRLRGLRESISALREGGAAIPAVLLRIADDLAAQTLAVTLTCPVCTAPVGVPVTVGGRQAPEPGSELCPLCADALAGPGRPLESRSA